MQISMLMQKPLMLSHDDDILGESLDEEIEN